MTGFWKINNKDAYTIFGVSLLRGSYNEIMAPPTPRERLQHEALDVNGTLVDTISELYYKERKYSIDILIVGSNYADFWTKYNAFFAEISTPGAFTLKVADLGVTVTLLYEGATCVKKPRSLRSGRVAVQYKVEVKEFNPTNRLYDTD